MNYQPILDQIFTEIQPQVGIGKVASYIPELANVSPDQFGMAIVDLKGNVYSVGAARNRAGELLTMVAQKIRTPPSSCSPLSCG